MVNKVDDSVLGLIVEYLLHHEGRKPKAIAKPIRSDILRQIVEDEWDAHFIDKLSIKVTLEVIKGANYMDLPSLLHLGCAKIATLIKGKSPDEIRTILGNAISD